MPTPRQQAERYNSQGFEDAEAGYDSAAGAPNGTVPSGAVPSYLVNATNPPEPPVEATNLKG